MNWLARNVLKIVVIGLSVFFLTRFVEGIQIESINAAIFFSFLLAVLNAFVRPILVLITLPISILTLGLFLFVINTALFWFAGSFVEGVQMEGIIPALIGALLVSAISWLFDFFFQGKND